MYITKIEIPSVQIKKMSNSSSEYCVHQWIIENLFAGLDSETQPFVFSSDIFKRNCRVTFYSKLKPSSSDYIRSSGLIHESAFSAGSKLKFRVKISPVYTFKDTSKKTAQMLSFKVNDWFEKRIEDSFCVDKYVVSLNKKVFKKKGNEFTLSDHTVEGELIVVNRDSFIDFLERGMGGKKSFGFGLMNLRLNT